MTSSTQFSRWDRAGLGGTGATQSETVDMFPDEYTIQKHIANAWAGEPIAQSKSVEVLATLSQQEKFQTDLISHGALEPLLSLIRSTQTNSTILRNCAQVSAPATSSPTTPPPCLPCHLTCESTLPIHTGPLPLAQDPP